MYAQQRVALDADHLTLRPAVGRITLPAPDKVRQRVVDDSNFGARRPGIEEERLVPVHDLRNRAGHLCAFRDGAVKLVEPEPPRLVAGVHRIPGVVVDALCAAGQRRPRPDVEVRGGHRGTDVHRDGAEAALQFAHPEALPAPVVAERSREVEQRRPPGRVAIDKRRVLRIKRGPVEVHLSGHRPVVGLSLPVVRRREQSDPCRMARDDRRRRHLFDCLVAVVQVLAELVGDERLPVDVVGVGEDRAHAAWLDLVPVAEPPVPRLIEFLERAVLHLKPATEAANRVRAKAELGVRDPRRVCPVDDVRLAPQVPPEKGRTAPRAHGQRRIEGVVCRAHARVIATVARRRLGTNRLPVRRDEQGIRELLAHPLRRRIHVDLQDQLEPLLFGKLQQHVERLEAVLTFDRLARSPVDPGPHRVEAEGLDLPDVFSPDLLFRSRMALDHRRACLAAAVPDGDGEEPRGGGRRLRGREARAGQEDRDRAEPGKTVSSQCHVRRRS